MIIGELIFISLFGLLASKFFIKRFIKLVFFITLTLGLLNLLLCITLFFLGEIKSANSLILASSAFLSFSIGQYFFYGRK
jgi:hypothetical protein